MSISLISVLAWLATLPPSEALAGPGDPTLNKLEGDFLSMAEVRLASGAAQLIVFEAEAKPTPGARRRRWAELFDKRQGSLTKSPTVALPADAAAFDVCRLDPKSTATTVLLVRKRGVYVLGSETPLAAVETLFAHARDDALPRVRLCFELFAAGETALVVPQLQGVTVFRQTKPRAFARHAALDVEAELGFQGQVLRGDDLASVQRLATRFQFPDVTAPDFDGDGLIDLCFNAEEALSCRVQHATRGFAEAREIKQFVSVRTPEERQDTSLRVTSRLLDLSGDGRPDFVVAKATWNVSAMAASMHIYVQSGGTFPKTPTQVIERQGYFAYQEYLDLDGDGRRDVLAPVAALGWTDLARIYLSRSADIEFVWYRNKGDGTFEVKTRTIHTLSFPVEFKNITAILGSLPLWDVRLKPPREGRPGERQALFFPKKNSFELRAMTPNGAGDVLWQASAKIGSETIAVDLDGDGRHEVVSAYPRDPERAGALLFVETP